MRRKIIGMALVVMLGVALVGCQTTSGYYDPTMSAGAGLLGGGAGGAVLGAIIGAATGNPGAGAAIGAATGAAVGGLGGALYANNQNRGQAAQGPPPGYGYPQGYYSPQGYSTPRGYRNPQGYDNSQSYDNSEGYWKTPGNGPSPGYGPSSYSSSGGNAVAIDQASVNPVRVRPGSQVMLSMNYRVSAPQDQPVSVKLVREISRDGQLMDQPYDEPRQVQNGPHAARVAYHIPPDAAPGNYVATFKVVSDQGTSERRVNFSVQ